MSQGLCCSLKTPWWTSLWPARGRKYIAPLRELGQMSTLGLNKGLDHLLSLLCWYKFHHYILEAPDERGLTKGHTKALPILCIHILLALRMFIACVYWLTWIVIMCNNQMLIVSLGPYILCWILTVTHEPPHLIDEAKEAPSDHRVCPQPDAGRWQRGWLIDQGLAQSWLFCSLRLLWWAESQHGIIVW